MRANICTEGSNPFLSARPSTGEGGPEKAVSPCNPILSQTGPQDSVGGSPEFASTSDGGRDFGTFEGKATRTGTLNRATRRQLGAGEVDFESCGGVWDACFDGPKRSFFQIDADLVFPRALTSVALSPRRGGILVAAGDSTIPE